MVDSIVVSARIGGVARKYQVSDVSGAEEARQTVISALDEEGVVPDCVIALVPRKTATAGIPEIVDG